MILFKILALVIVAGGAQASIKLAITIDDLPAHAKIPAGTTRLELTKKMLRTLKDNHIPEVYGFINAGKVEDEPDLIDVLKLWRAAGYPLGNHTFSHPNLNKTDVDVFEKNIDSNEATLKSLGGDSDWHVFRYPFLIEGNSLEKRNAIRTHLKEKGYRVAEVTVDFEDWSWNNPYVRCLAQHDRAKIAWLKKTYIENAAAMLERADKLSTFLFKKPIPHILLLHIGVFDTEMLSTLIKTYRAKGVEFIPLSEALQDDIYAFDPGATFERGSEFTYQVLKSRGLSSKDAGLAPYNDYPEADLEKACAGANL